MKQVYLHAGGGRDYDIEKVLAVSTEELPEEYILPELPDVLDQKNTLTCAAHAIAETMQIAFLKATGLKVDFSIVMIYGLWRNHPGGGMLLNTALSYGREIGTAERYHAPGLLEVPEAIRQAQIYANNNFKCYKIGTYYRIGKTAEFAEKVKRALYQFKIPIVTVLKQSTYNHAEIIIGWNKQGFILQDSYGADKWQNGRHTKSEKTMKEAYVILMDNIQVPFTDIKGHWAERDIEKMFHAGLIEGRTPTEFCPDETMTRAEVATLLSRLTKKYDEIIVALESE